MPVSATGRFQHLGSPHLAVDSEGKACRRAKTAEVSQKRILAETSLSRSRPKRPPSILK